MAADHHILSLGSEFRHGSSRKSSEILPEQRVSPFRAVHPLGRRGPATGRTSAQSGNGPNLIRVPRRVPPHRRPAFRSSADRKTGYEEEEEDAAAAKPRLDRLDVFEKVRPMKPKLFGNTHS